MSPILHTLIGNTTIALVISLLALLSMRLRKPALAHALWLLVLLKLITPSLLPAPIPADALLPSTHVANRLAQTPPAADARPLVGQTFLSATGEGTPSPVLSDHFITTPAVQTTSPFPWHLATLLLYSAVTLTLLTLALTRTLRFHRSLHRAPLADPSLLPELPSLARRLDLDWTPDVRLLPTAPGPLIYFTPFHRPCLVLPPQLLSTLPPDRRSTILAHELAHLRRGDHWVRLLELLVTSILWFHPLVWVARRGLRESEEHCCDAWVLHALPHARHAYASALVDVVEHFSAPAAPATPVATGLGQLKHLQRRLVMITTHTPSRSLSLAAKAVVTCALVALPLTPHLVHGQSDDRDVTVGRAPAGTPEHDVDRLIGQKLTRPADHVQEMAPPTDRSLDTPEDRERKILELEDRISELERRLAAAEQTAHAAQATDAAADRQKRIDANRVKARERMRQDVRKYTPQQLGELEKLYQEANANLRAPEALDKLRQLVAWRGSQEKWPDANRVGCAVMYLAQRTTGDEQFKWLNLAADKYADCFYGNGVQVGAYARFFLAQLYRQQGKSDLARQAADELLTRYPDAIDHNGDPLAQSLRDLGLLPSKP